MSEILSQKDLDKDEKAFFEKRINFFTNIKKAQTSKQILKVLQANVPISKEMHALAKSIRSGHFHYEYNYPGFEEVSKLFLVNFSNTLKLFHNNLLLLMMYYANIEPDGTTRFFEDGGIDGVDFPSDEVEDMKYEDENQRDILTIARALIAYPYKNDPTLDDEEDEEIDAVSLELDKGEVLKRLCYVSTSKLKTIDKINLLNLGQIGADMKKLKLTEGLTAGQKKLFKIT